MWVFLLLFEFVFKLGNISALGTPDSLLRVNHPCVFMAFSFLYFLSLDESSISFLSKRLILTML